MAVLTPQDAAAWHALRAKVIGGSEVAALFNASPYATHFTLWHEKKGNAAPDFTDNDRTRWGKMLEPLLAQEIGTKLGWKLQPTKKHYTHPTVRMGCTLDFDVLDHEWGPGIVETKVVFEYADYMRDWSEERAPPNYELQVQHQLACTGLPWCAIIVWCAQTCTLAPALIRRRDDKVIGEIERRITAFWQSIEKNEPPQPSGGSGATDELAIIRHLWPEREPKKVIEIADVALAESAQMYQWATEQEGGMKSERATRKAMLMGAAKDAEIMKLPGYTVYVKQNKKGSITLDVREDAANGIVADPAKSTINAG